jgi:uncharacterized FlgJ-related protein
MISISNKLFLLFIVVATLGFGGCQERSKSSMPVKKAEVKKAEVKTAPQKRIVYTSSIRDIEQLFEDINYSMKRWNDGEREIPRIYIMDISPRWQKQSQKMDVKLKKAIFFQLTLPLVLHANELILQERKRLLSCLGRHDHLGDEESRWLMDIAKKYKVVKKESNETLSSEKLNMLKRRVNVIPPSLALAQAAEESGWGTSRFAILGNSLFGQWAFSKSAMRPKQQRSELGDYGLARFKTPQDAVNAYMLNLNTHRAYKKMRTYRARLIKEGKRVSGYELARMLDKYSERGQEYVDSLHAMMRINHLGDTDDAYLWSRGDILMIPLKKAKAAKEAKAI